MDRVQLMRFEIRMHGEWTPRAAEEFADALVNVDGDDVLLLLADVDQAGLHGLLERIRRLGYELVDVRRSRRRGLDHGNGTHG